MIVCRSIPPFAAAEAAAEVVRAPLLSVACSTYIQAGLLPLERPETVVLQQLA